MRFRVPGRVPTAPPSRPGVPPMRPQQTGTSPAGGPATGATGGEPQFVNMLRQFLSSANQEQTGPQSTGTQSTPASTQSTQANNQSSSSGAGTGQAGQQPISDEAFTQLVSGITGYMSQAAVGQAPRQTIADFLSGLGESYNVPQGEGFINECLSCVLASLQITDLIQVFYGQPTPLNQVQRPLREFISTRVLDGLPALQGTIRDAVETLVDSMQPEIAEAVAVSQPRPHIDFQATLMGFFSQNLFNIITLAMNARENDPNFGADLYACVRRTLSELYILCGRCLGGREAVENLLANRLQRFTSGVNPFIQEWMSSMTLRQLSGFYPSITVTEGEISHFIVYKSVGQPSGATQSRTQTKSSAKPVSKLSAASSATPTSSSAPESERSTVGTSTSTKPESSPVQAPVLKQAIKQKEESQPMETSPPVSSTSPGASEVEMDTVTRVTPTREVKGAASADSSSSQISPITNGNQPSPVGAQAGSDNWESVVPAEWVPVISRDIEAQRQPAQQRPFSDVYMQGMPPKRRKIMADQKATDLSNSARALPHSIQRAVAAAAVEPISSMENLQTELAADTNLQEAFQSEVSSSLAERLESDSDFRAEQFPNSNEYYHKSAGKK